MDVVVKTSEEYKTLAEYEVVQKRRIADSWNPDQERILRIWAEKASGWAWLHDKAARYYNQLTNRFAYPSIFLSTVSGGLGFSIYGMDIKKDSRYITIVIGCMNLAAAFLSSLQKFVRSTEKAEIHNHMNKLFSTFYRRIVMELALKPADRRDCLEFCKSCRDEYDKLVVDSLEIPDFIIQRFKTIFANAKHVPEIANGLVHFHDYRQTQEGLEYDKRKSCTLRIPPTTVNVDDESTEGFTKDRV